MAASGGKPVVLRALRTATGPAVNNSTVVVDDAVLVIPLDVGATYFVSGFIAVSTTTSADAVLRLSGPSGASGVWGTGGATVNNLAYGYGETSFNMNGAGSSGYIILGTITVGGTGGNLVVGHAQGTATAVDTVLVTGSWLQVERV